MARKKETATIDASGYDYGTVKVKDKSGKTRASTGNGDAVQRAMLRHVAAGKTLEQVIRANKLTQEPAKYDNQGLLRMSVGNSLRAMVRRGEHVVIGDVTIKSLEQRVALDEVKDGAKSKPAKKAKKAGGRKKAVNELPAAPAE